MDLTQLQYFKIIAETGSLTKAAEILHISQPAMSSMLKKFEEELDVELFDRSPNRIQLNQTGEIALIHVNSILRNIEQMKSDLLSHSQQNLSISIAFCDPGIHWFCIPRFPFAFPDTKVIGDLYEDEDEVKLLLGRNYDIVVTSAKVQHTNIQSIPFLSDRVYLSVPATNKLINKESVSLRELPAQPLLIPNIGGYFLRQLEKIILKENPQVTLVKNDFIITQQLIRNTNFLATSSALAIELRNDGSHRKLIPLNDPEQNLTYHISFLKSNKEKIKQFLMWVENLKNTNAIPEFDSFRL